MLSGLRIFAPPKFPVLSLDVRAQIPVAEVRERSQFHLLVLHCLERFFNNELISAEGDAKARLLQVMYATTLPGMVAALFLSPVYHAPLPRPFWSQVSDHYFYVMYSLIAVGLMSIFAWDLFYPDLADVLVLTPLPLRDGSLFRARIVASGIFIGLFVTGAGALGTVFYPLLTEPPDVARHLFAHLVAILTSGTFAALFFLSLQGTLMAILGQRFFRSIAPFLQCISTMVLLTALMLFPVSSRYLETLLTGSAARFFPPFWFLGVYESILGGSSAKTLFRELANTGYLAVGVATVVAVIAYPLAYRRRMRFLVEGSDRLNTRNPIALSTRRLLHATLLRNPVQRGIYHFISYSLLRTQRHRVYLAMYAGVGLAILTACTVLLHLSHGHIRVVLSPFGLRAAVPIAAFWTIAGLRTAFLSSTQKSAGWIFRVILGRPGLVQLETSSLWILPWVLAFSLAIVVLTTFVGPVELQNPRAVIARVLIASGLCLLLTDVLFLKVTSVPFTGEGRAPGKNLAWILLQYFGLFPPLVVFTISFEPWLAINVWHGVTTVGIIAVAHLGMRKIQRQNAEYNANLIDLDDDEEEFPQRLGLRY